MKRIALVSLFVMWIVPSPVQAFPFDALIGLLPSLTDPEAERAHSAPLHPVPLSGLDLIISTFDKEIIGKFRDAWQRVGNGTLGRESVVLILKMANGGYSARLPNPTNEYKSFTFQWHPATVAIVHTHPNGSRPVPEGGDLVTAEKFNVPIFTLTSRGVWVYDPSTKKTSKVLDGLEWLDDSAWRKMQSHLGGGLPKRAS